MFVIDWLVENRVIYLRVWGRLRAKDMQQLDEILNRYISSASQEQVHILTDNVDLLALPGMREPRQQTYLHHPKLGCIITTSKLPLPGIIGGIVGQLSGAEFVFVTNAEQGVGYLSDTQPNLPDHLTLCERLHALRAKPLHQGDASRTVQA